MKLYELIQTNQSASDIEEGWKETAAALGMAGALTAGSFMGSKHDTDKVSSNAPVHTQSSQHKKQQIKTPIAKHAVATAPVKSDKALAAINDYLAKHTDERGAALAKVLMREAIKQGIVGDELQQLMIQAAHETKDFNHLKEIGTPRYFTRLYDKSINPRKAKILGNTHAGDGARFCGRGFLHITGRDNATRAGAALGLPLDTHPELMERPDIAAKVSIWFWKNRVQAKAKDVSDINSVTKIINPGMKGMKSRKQKQSQISGIETPDKKS